jgi:hypothetical protein
LRALPIEIFVEDLAAVLAADGFGPHRAVAELALRGVCVAGAARSQPVAGPVLNFRKSSTITLSARLKI